MPETLKRLFTIADPYMLQFAKALRSWFIADQAEFAAEDSNYANPFEDDWETAIATAENEPSDEQRKDQLQQLTAAVDDRMTDCRDVFQSSKRYIKKAFPNSSAHWNEFGFDDYDRIEDSHPRMIQFMKRFHSTAVKYAAELAAPEVNFGAARVAAIATAKTALEDADNAQEVFKKDMLTFTHTRVQKLNAVWNICTDVAATGKFLFRNDAARYQHYLLPAAEEAQGVLQLTGVVSNMMTGGPAEGVAVRIEDAMGVELVTVQTGPDGSYGLGGLPVGNYNARFMHALYIEALFSVEIVAGTTANLDVQLNPIAPPPAP